MSPKFHDLTQHLLANIQKNDVDTVRCSLLDMLIELNLIDSDLQRAKAKAEAEQLLPCDPAYFVPDPYEEAKGIHET